VNNPLENIPPLTVEAQVLDRLREAILQGYFPAGSQLNQVKVAAQFGVSRGPVRAAINNLEKENLVKNIPHRGSFVTTLDKQAIQDLYQVRAILEGYAVRLAVETCTAADVDKIMDLIEEIRAAARRGDTDEVVRLDFQIHEFFVDLSGNSFLIQIWSTIKIHVRRALSMRHHSYPDLIDIADSHLPFCELIQTRKAAEAGRTMELHITDALTDLLERWGISERQTGLQPNEE
jgi:DNA-binding GntR family transcriptional regulator